MSRGGVARHAVIGGVAAAAGALAGIGLMRLLFSPAVTFLGLALGGTGFERAWLAVLITLPLAVVGFLGIGQLLPGVPWWFWPVTVAIAAAASVWLAAALPAPVLSRSRRR